MRRELFGYGLLLAVSLGGAYYASLPQADQSKGEEIVFSPSQNVISQLSFKSKNASLTATRREGDGRYLLTWVKGEKPAEVYLGNKKFNELLKSFTPFIASRVLTDLPKDQKNDFGLKESEDLLTLTDKSGAVYSLVLGKKGYGGDSRFAEEKDGQKRVMIVDGRGFDSLGRSNVAHFDRDVTSFDPQDATSAELVKAGKTLTVLQKARGSEGALVWTLEDEKPNASLQTWMERVQKLRIINYSEPKEVKPASLLTIRYKKGQTELDVVEVLKDGVRFWAKSTYLGGTAEIDGSKLESLEKDLTMFWPKN